MSILRYFLGLDRKWFTIAIVIIPEIITNIRETDDLITYVSWCFHLAVCRRWRCELQVAGAGAGCWVPAAAENEMIIDALDQQTLPLPIFGIFVTGPSHIAPGTGSKMMVHEFSQSGAQQRDHRRALLESLTSI